ncbi:P-loop NTPase fold protein [Nostoc sp. 'Peltigera membranacea cyanobiont' 232]|uniref:P-loop NTPase fold protein n=1 Tax=Nostoc sp. 'Peltigera membranacea cyanobiont' 232 TaxID=2014531 RepID=UPI000B95381B|nr:P-loop NTPase fold protein [Nostoc sp. 'Peltigera membranacea cyanobiont' 232]OYE03092.1 pilus assembly protein PilB [Nostoc sp. 'Peltigera membranacea cyanobiont' 232]
MPQDFHRQLYNMFNPFNPLEPGDLAYVDCQEVRGDGDIRMQLGNSIVLSDQLIYQLYTGHRGAGKSTELKRLKEYLEEKDFYVVYFAAGNDFEEEDIQHTDILLACTRYLIEALKDYANANPLVDWLKERWKSLEELASTEISFDQANIELGISQFAKVTAVMKSSPRTRNKIQQEVEKHTPSLIEELNKFIAQAKLKLADKYLGIVVIADNLDRIGIVFDQASQRSNHDQIFIDRSEQLKRLQCHMIYTVPISMVYSDRATILEDRFGLIQSLPMIMTHTPDGREYQRGIDKLKELIERRIQLISNKLTLSQVFEDEKILKNLCLMSGGHVRNLVLLIRTALERTLTLPVSEKTAQRAITEMRNTYRKAINENEWQILAKVYLSKEKSNNYDYHKLLFHRCILEYHLIEAYNIKPWYNIHPLICDIEEFQRALEKEKKE